MAGTTFPYLLDEPPTSTGKALLSRALSHWCALHDGLAPDEIASALDSPDLVDRQTRAAVGNAASLLGELFAAGDMRTFADRSAAATRNPCRQPTGSWTTSVRAWPAAP